MPEICPNFDRWSLEMSGVCCIELRTVCTARAAFVFLASPDCCGPLPPWIENPLQLEIFCSFSSKLQQMRFTVPSSSFSCLLPCSPALRSSGNSTSMPGKFQSKNWRIVLKCAEMCWAMNRPSTRIRQCPTMSGSIRQWQRSTITMTNKKRRAAWLELVEKRW